MAFSDTWTESDPTGSTYANTLATILTQAVKRALRERLAIDHYFYASEGSYTDVGYHKQVTLPVLAANPTEVASAGILFTKDVTAKGELHYIDEDGNVIQLTSAGALNQDLSTAVILTGDQTVAGVKTFSSSPIVPTPTTDYQASTKKYVDGKFPTSSISGVFGAWVDKSASYAAQQAATDGFVTVWARYDTPAGQTPITIICYTDSNADPTTVRGKGAVTNPGANYDPMYYYNFTMPVKKNDYWKITRSGTPNDWAVYWIPLGS